MYLEGALYKCSIK